MDEDLLSRAREALDAAYAPYSEYPVGAAIATTGGAVYTGCNVENANFSNSLHAEEVALGSAVRDGHREFDRLAVVSGAGDGLTPCGSCRQTLTEFCGPEFRVLCEDDGDRIEYTLGELLPDAITRETLEDHV